MELFLGTQGWSYVDWIGDMYDSATKPDRYLRAYAEEFRSVEIDSTFYGTPTEERVRRWCAQVPPSFRFSLKVPREITHDYRLVGAKPLFDAFFDVTRAFGSQLGCVLMQFGADFTRAEEGAMRTALDWLPADIPIAIELRDPAWYEAQFQADLAGRGIALAVTDAPFVDRSLMLATLARTTTEFAYVRWIGNHDALSRFDRVQIARDGEIASWTEALRKPPQSIRRVYGYVNNHYQGHAPATVRSLMSALGLQHERPTRVRQGELF